MESKKLDRICHMWEALHWKSNAFRMLNTICYSIYMICSYILKAQRVFVAREMVTSCLIIRTYQYWYSLGS